MQRVSSSIPILPLHNGALGLLIEPLRRFHDLGSSSARHARFPLFDEVTFLQGLEKLLHIALR